MKGSLRESKSPKEPFTESASVKGSPAERKSPKGRSRASAQENAATFALAHSA